MLILLCGLASMGAMEVSPNMPIAQRLECMQANAATRLKITDVRLENSLAGGEEVIQARYYSQRERDGFKAMLHLTSPQSLAGTRYLLIEGNPDDALYVYLPAVGKVRRVSGASAEAGIAGTPLKFSDLRLFGQALKASSITHEGETALAGRFADVLRFSPAIADSPFRRARVTVDRKTCVILRAEFDRPEGVARRYVADPASLMRSREFDYASVATVEDLRDDSEVRILLRGVQAGASLSRRLFDPEHFHRQD